MAKSRWCFYITCCSNFLNWKLLAFWLQYELHFIRRIAFVGYGLFSTGSSSLTGSVTFRRFLLILFAFFCRCLNHLYELRVTWNLQSNVTKAFYTCSPWIRDFFLFQLTMLTSCGKLMNVVVVENNIRLLFRIGPRCHDKFVPTIMIKSSRSILPWNFKRVESL